MATNFVQAGTTMPYTNGTGAAIASSSPVAIGCLLCVAAVDIANTATGTVYRKGDFNLPVNAAANIAQGDLLNWDDSAGELTTAATAAAGDITGAAVAITAAGPGIAVAQVSINDTQATAS